MLKKSIKLSVSDPGQLNRRQFLKAGSFAGAGIILGTPKLWAQDQKKKSDKPQTNVKDVLNIPKTKHSLPGPFPGRVIEVKNEQVLKESKPDPAIVRGMFESGIKSLTGKNIPESFKLLFDQNDIVGIKVNPVGAGLISTRLEVVDEVIHWLTQNGLKRKQIVIWDRFDYMLSDAGFTSERFPGVQIEGLQTMDEAAAEGEAKDNSRWLKPDGTHMSAHLFDKDVFYWADVEASKEESYLNQHVVNDKHSYFGKLITQTLTKIINIPVFKNTGNGISMATKNIGYGAICNTGRLHRPLFFDVCTEVLAFPDIRDKLVLNITDGLVGQYDGGPGPNAQFIYNYNRLFFATDPFALDLVCHNLILQKRKEMGVKVNEHPRYTEYLRYAQKLGLGIAEPDKIEHVLV